MLIERMNVLKTGARNSVDQMLRAIDARQPLSEGSRDALRLVSMELLNNIADHSSADVVELSCKLQDGVVSITIDDNGPGFDYHEVMERSMVDPFDERGRGMLIVQAIADELRYNPAGNSVRVVLRING
ncbi:MAG: ATP-binding protein [Clostridia bacterium]|nr:ATP-binding protein [Clostridia bacterium]